MARESKQILADRTTMLFRKFGEERAIQYQGRWFTWAEVGRTDQLLRELLTSLDDDATIAVVLRSRPWCLSAVIALLGSGRCSVLVSPIQPDLPILAEIRSLHPAALIADVEDWGRSGVEETCAELGVMGIELRDDPDYPVRARPALDRVAPGHGRIPADVAITALTSGTTGQPKRIPVRWDDLLPRVGAPRVPGSRRGVNINVLPLFSIGGIAVVSDTVFGGRPTSLLDRFDVTEWAGLIYEHQPRRAGAPPAVLRMVLDADIPVQWFKTVTSIYTASAPLSRELASEFEARYGIPVVQGYGATEFLGGVTGWPADLHERFGVAKRGSVGRPMPGVRLRVVDHATGEELSSNEVGNLEVDSPRRAKGIPSGWVRTNDLARIDEDGFVWILGRSDDVIIRGGFKVHLAEVEAALMEHPQVGDACVVGVPDERVGQLPYAAVVIPDGARVDAAQLIEWVRARLPSYMTPAAVRIVGAIPLNSMMKKDRRSVAKLFESQDAN